jgi:hypothetical protein
MSWGLETMQANSRPVTVDSVFPYVTVWSPDERYRNRLRKRAYGGKKHILAENLLDLIVWIDFPASIGKE